jgi:hypothetical protein
MNHIKYPRYEIRGDKPGHVFHGNGSSGGGGGGGGGASGELGGTSGSKALDGAGRDSKEAWKGSGSATNKIELNKGEGGPLNGGATHHATVVKRGNEYVAQVVTKAPGDRMATEVMGGSFKNPKAAVKAVDEVMSKVSGTPKSSPSNVVYHD